MNHLGMTLAWLAVELAIVLLPALGLQALASRRGPASGAWVATLSLGLVVVLGAVAFVPRAWPDAEAIPAGPGRSTEGPTPSIPGGSPLASASKIEEPNPGTPGTGRGLSFNALRESWARLGRRAAEPAERFRDWGNSVAIACLVGTGVGSCRLLIGLWAVALCRKRGRAVEDPTLVALLDELRGSMGCRPEVELREMADLTTPATAGWRRPMLLLPNDWRSWDESERRAVVAHELAHIIRGDYAAGLLARIAVVLNYHHPLVRWMAARLHLEQELAADSMGARFSGGRAAYLVALSSLALKKDGRSPTWPARAFLPARGTLIRRIAMLRNETETRSTGMARSKAWRLSTALGLLALTIGVATLKGPARADDQAPAPTTDRGIKAPDDREAATPFEVKYLPDRMCGVIAFRPAAILRRPGMGRLKKLIEELMAEDRAELAKELGVDTTKPGRMKLGPEDIEFVVSGIDFGQSIGQERKLHRIEAGDTGGLIVRAVTPFDWLAILREWNIDLEEVREARGVYHKIKAPAVVKLGLHVGIYLPDDRTIVYETEKGLKELLASEAPSAPEYLRGPDWERASRGLVAVAINNHDDVFAKRYDLGRPDDAMVLSLFKGVDRWVFGVAEADPIITRAEVTGRDPQAAEAVTRSIKRLVNLGLEALENAPGVAAEYASKVRIAKGFLANLKVGQDGRSLALSAEGFGTFADVATFIKVEEAEPRARESKANPKTEKR